MQRHTTKPRPQIDMFADTEITENITFQQYHKKHPKVYTTFKKLTLEAIGKGFKHFSARGIFQVMRFLRHDEIKDDGFKYNNNYTPYYVRMFVKEFPEHINFFERRKTKYSVEA